MESTSDLIGGMLPTVLVLLAVLFGLRRLAKRPVTRRGGGMRVAERTGVARGALVAIVEADERRFLVGVSEHGVNLLTELDARSEAVDVPAAVDPTAGAVGPHRPEAGLQPIRPRTAGRHAAGRNTIRPRTDAGPHSDTDRPRSGLVHRLQQMTVRTHVEASLRELT